jgi:hypothetical protein
MPQRYFINCIHISIHLLISFRPALLLNFLCIFGAKLSNQQYITLAHLRLPSYAVCPSVLIRFLRAKPLRGRKTSVKSYFVSYSGTTYPIRRLWTHANKKPYAVNIRLTQALASTSFQLNST